jgi:dTDP-4-dehydrorhamnose 3,5-epimerase
MVQGPDMNFKKGNINGVIVKKISRFSDKRGWLSEFWRDDEMRSYFQPAMGYLSMTLPGIARGPHEHVTQTDCFFFPGFSTFRVMLWDNRADSGTYGNFMDLDAKTDDPAVVVVPPGIVHAYKNTGKGLGLVVNLPDRLYAGENKTEKVDEIRHENDPDSPYKMD